MANFKMKGHTIFTQSGTDTPTWGTGAPTGAVLQVVGNTIKSTTISHTGTFSDWEAITGFYVDITPKKTNSDFFIILTTSIGGNGNAEGAIKIARGYDSSGGTTFSYTDILGDASGSATRTLYASGYDISVEHLITTSSHIWDDGISYASGGKFRFQVYWRNPHNTSGDLFLNRGEQNDRAENMTGVSSIIVQEIAGI